MARRDMVPDMGEGTPEQVDRRGAHAGARRPPMGGLLGAVASSVYRRIMARRNRKYDAGRGVLTFDRPVVSVGNLSVGGTGKTPMVLHLARLLREEGHWPCIAMRGYGAAPGAGNESDEAGTYLRALPDVPLVAQPDRAAGLIDLFGREEGERVDCIILDDGFQHRRIARQFDLVLIDATRPPFGDKLLPAGWLREPVSSLSRADGAVVTHAEAVTKTDGIELETKLWNFLPRGVVAVCRHAWEGLVVVDGAGGEAVETEQSVQWLAGGRVAVACAIGNPGPFLAEAEKAVGPGGEVCYSMVLRDHDPFEAATIQRLLEGVKAAGAAALLVTEKDWSKLRRVRPEAWPCPVVRPRLELRFDRQQAELEASVIAAVEGFEADA